MSFILKLLELGSIFIYVQSTPEHAINIIRIWYIIEHGSNPSTIKKYCFFTSNPENCAFSLKKYLTGGSKKHNIRKEQLRRRLVRGLVKQTSAETKTILNMFLGQK